MKIAVILFPGLNCEEETALAIKSAGMDADIIRWNDTENLHKYDGYALSGGWSYEDRIRAGVIAAQDPVMDIIKEQASKGKPVLGICNGAQMLVESGLIPGIEKKVQMALAPNINPFISGYYCTWVYIKSNNTISIFNKKIKNEIIPIPIAHGEGRFTTKDKAVIEKLVKNKQIAFSYCDKKGRVVDEFPINPNGSIMNIAGICNPEGNVMAMMPHPERANWIRQLPNKVNTTFEEMEKPAPARKIFEAMKEYIKANK